MRRVIKSSSMLVLVALAMAAGCQRSTTTDADLQKKLEAQVGAAPTTVLNTHIGEPSESPSQQATHTSVRPSTPDGICREFLDCLARGDSKNAEQYLTATSVINARKAGLDWQSPGSPQASYTLRAPRYATSKEDLATVVCMIVDQIEGVEEASEITWMLRNSAQGWRICGMVVALDENSPPELLSFENIEDIQWIQAGVNGAEAAVAEGVSDPLK